MALTVFRASTDVCNDFVTFSMSLATLTSHTCIIFILGSPSTILVRKTRTCSCSLSQKQTLKQHCRERFCISSPYTRRDESRMHLNESNNNKQLQVTFSLWLVTLVFVPGRDCDRASGRPLYHYQLIRVVVCFIMQQKVLNCPLFNL